MASAPPSQVDIYAALQAQSSSSLRSKSRTGNHTYNDFPNLKELENEGDGKNKRKMYCPRDGCGCLLLSTGAGEIKEVQSDSAQLQRDETSPFLPDPTSTSTSTSSPSYLTWHIQGLPLIFENIGFTHSPAGKTWKYLVCADCDCGPLGWTSEDGKEGWLGVGRVRYGALEGDEGKKIGGG